MSNRAALTGFTGSLQEWLSRIQVDGHTDVTIGGMSGHIHRLSVGEVMSVSKRAGYKGNIYTLTGDPGSILTHSTAGQGSPAGGTKNRTWKRGYTILRTKEAIRDRLLELAVDLEQMTSPLSTFSTEQLLAELVKRQRSSAK